MATALLLFCLLNAYQVFGLKCFSCDSASHPGVCDYYGNLTREHTQHIVECQGSCKVGSLRDKTNEVHLRMCQPNIRNGCDYRKKGFICQCSTDFCNKNLITCHKDSQCKQDLHPRSIQMTQTSDGNREAITNRSVGSIAGVVTGCVCLLILTVAVVIMYKRGTRRGTLFHLVKTTNIFHAVTTIHSFNDPPARTNVQYNQCPQSSSSSNQSPEKNMACTSQSPVEEQPEENNIPAPPESDYCRPPPYPGIIP